jgi:hypothetical protein
MNALSHASSPYLRQHADNPVDWVEWSPAAFAEARRRDVPVLVSIGYATCHWCHVMAHESFEDAAVAELMNRLFVCVKVDREELPEVDEIYMDAVQALHGHGGWPLNAFADHDGRPFFAGTYFPKERWVELLGYLSDLWTRERPRIDAAASQLVGHLALLSTARRTPLPPDLRAHHADAVRRAFDAAHPGFGQAPKFPPSQWLVMALTVEDLRHREVALAILEAMQDSGLHDRVGGGFHRYSTDREWRVPHFEKMLYDQAQLAVAYALGHARTGRLDFERTARRIATYLERDLRVTDASGAFVGYASAEDADDPDGEGSFYAWSPGALVAALGPDEGSRLARDWHLAEGEREVGRSGHLEPVTQHIPHPRALGDLDAHARTIGHADAESLRASWEPHLDRLLALRSMRPRPIRDDKVLTDLNGLALIAFATLARVFSDPHFALRTRELASVLAGRLTPSGLLRLPGRAAFITDYGHLALGFLEAHRALGDVTYVTLAEQIVDEAVERLGASADDGGGFFTTPAGRADLVRRSRESHDGPYPAGAHALALAAVRLYAMTSKEGYRELADAVFSTQSATLDRAPLACPTLVHALYEAEAEPLHIVVAGEGPVTDRLLATARRWPGAASVLPTAGHAATGWPLFEGRLDLAPQALVCLGTRCLLPVTEPEALMAQLRAERVA